MPMSNHKAAIAKLELVAGGLSRPLSIKIAQEPYITGSLGPKALKYESFEGKGTSCNGGNGTKALDLLPA